MTASGVNTNIVIVIVSVSVHFVELKVIIMHMYSKEFYFSEAALCKINDVCLGIENVVNCALAIQ